MNAKKVTHRTMFRHLCENLDHKLDSPECRAIRKHLADCPECLTYLGSLKTTVALYRSYEAPPMSAAVRRKLRALATSQERPKTTRKRGV